MIKLINLLLEIGEGTEPYRWSGPDDGDGGIVSYRFKTEDGDYYLVSFSSTITDGYDSAFTLSFHVRDEEEGDSSSIITNKNRQFKIISTIMNIIESFIDEYPADMILFTGSDASTKKSNTNQRDLLYKAYINKNMHRFPEWHAVTSSSILRLIRNEKLPGMKLKR